MKAQYSLEYIMVIGITLLVLVPVTYLFLNYTKDSSEQMKYPQLNRIGTAIVNNAKSVYYAGEYSKLLIDVSVPENVNDVYILEDHELIFEIETRAGMNSMIFFSDVNITSTKCYDWAGITRCSLSNVSVTGVKKVRLQTTPEGNEVNISVVK